ncbi:MAG: hypothetical protein AABX02_01280 [archaeon]
MNLAWGLEQQGKEYRSALPHAPETIEHNVGITMRDLEKLLPANEYRVLLLHMMGYSETEIAHFSRRTPGWASKVLSNARERVAWKLKDHYINVKPRRESPPKRGNQFPRKAINTKKITKSMMPHRRLRKKG